MTVIALSVIAALVLSGQDSRTVREAAYDLNGISPVVRLVDGGRVCEAPVEAAGEFKRLVFWSSGVGSKALVSVHQGRSPNTVTVASGTLSSKFPWGGEHGVRLDQTVRPSPSMSVCVKSVLGAVTLYGGLSRYQSNDSGPPYGAPVIIGFHPESTLWLQAWSARPHGIWSSLSLAFHRMSLFRLSWVGAWTFWILLFSVFAGFPLLVLALWFALRADQGDSEHTPPQ